MLANFSLSHLRFTLVARETIRLPRFNKGITLRGGFGTVFRSLVCIERAARCDSCKIHVLCPYALVFSPVVTPEAERLRLNRDIPRPFVIKAPAGPKEVYERGELISFGLVLVGKARDFFPYFFMCFQRLGEKGIGSGRGRFDVAATAFLNADGSVTVAHEMGNTHVHVPPKGITFDEIASPQYVTESGPGLLRVHFLTPVLLKDKGKWTSPRFGPLMRRLRDRIHALAYFYCGETLDMDFSGFGNAAEAVVSEPEELEWVEEQRYAKHRDIRYPLKGYVGSMLYRGNLKPFLPFLHLGEYIHVGKAATFGQGWYKIDRGEGGTGNW